MKLLEEVKIALNNIENKLSKEKDYNLIIELICKNDLKTQKHNIEQINAIGCSAMLNDINAISSIVKSL